MNLEDQIKTAVDDLVRTVPHRPGLADVALRQARRRKHAARIAMASGTAVAVAASVPFAAGQLLDTSERPTGPEQTQAAVPGQRQPANTVTVDIDELEQGPPPSVPWAKDGSVYRGGQPLTIPRQSRELPRLYQVHGGMVIVQQGAPEQLVLRRDNGKREVLFGRQGGLAVGTTVVSADGRKVAWSTSRPSDAWPTKLYLADVVTGKITRQKQHQNVPIGGFIDDERVLLGKVNAPEGKSGIQVWDTRSNAITAWDGYQHISSLLGVSRSGELAIVETLEYSKPETSPADRDQEAPAMPAPTFCRAVVETATEKTLWNGCGKLREPGGEPLPYAFSPAGRTLLAAEDRNVVVADARSGRPVLTVELAADFVGEAVWESDDSFVFTVWEDHRRTALVRCTVEGECELAAPVLTFDPGRDTVEHEGYWPYATLR